MVTGWPFVMRLRFESGRVFWILLIIGAAGLLPSFAADLVTGVHKFDVLLASPETLFFIVVNVGLTLYFLIKLDKFAVATALKF